MVRPTTAAVLPIRGHDHLLDGCLESLMHQTVPLDQIVVVDDSPEGSLEDIEGVVVLRSHGRGPYAARNMGWQATDADVVFFLDARSRPRTTWVQELTSPFSDPDVALVGSDVLVTNGTSIGAQASHRAQFFLAKNYVDNASFRPYFPTCNLAVRRDDLARVDGFVGVRSGGDADLCWRVLAEPGRKLRVAEGVQMDWLPRDGIRDVLGQTFKYGKSHFALLAVWRGEGAPGRKPASHARLTVRVARLAARFGAARLLGDDERAADLLASATFASFDVGYRLTVDGDRIRRLRRRL